MTVMLASEALYEFRVLTLLARISYSTSASPWLLEEGWPIFFPLISLPSSKMQRIVLFDVSSGISFSRARGCMFIKRLLQIFISRSDISGRGPRGDLATRIPPGSRARSGRQSSDAGTKWSSSRSTGMVYWYSPKPPVAIARRRPQRRHE